MPLAHIIRAQAAIKIVAFTILVVVGLACTQAKARNQITQTGMVTRVVDGDTVWVQVQGLDKPLKLRIEGIDAPEMCQPGGAVARTALDKLVMGQNVTVTARAHDDYGRTVGSLRMQGQDVARWMVANGHAWVYTFRSKKGPYSSEFARAQTDRRGLFGEAGAQEPRQFRKMYGACPISAYRPTK